MGKLLEILKTKAIDDYREFYGTKSHEKCARDIESFLDSDSTVLAMCMPPRSGKTSLFSLAVPLYWNNLNPESGVYLTSYSQDLAKRNAHIAKSIGAKNINHINIENITGINTNSLYILDDPTKPNHTKKEIIAIAESIAKLIDRAELTDSKVLICASRMNVFKTDVIKELQKLKCFDLLNYKAPEDDPEMQDMKNKNYRVFMSQYLQNPPTK